MSEIEDHERSKKNISPNVWLTAILLLFVINRQITAILRVI